MTIIVKGKKYFVLGSYPAKYFEQNNETITKRHKRNGRVIIYMKDNNSFAICQLIEEAEFNDTINGTHTKGLDTVTGTEAKTIEASEPPASN